MKSTTTIELQKFCGEDGRYNFSKPFVRNRWLYAVDGAIAVRVQAFYEPDSPDKGLPPVDDLPWDLCLDANLPFPGEGVLIEKDHDCFECDDGIIGGAECDECCNGRIYGTNRKHKKCNGTGVIGGKKCTNCVDGVLSGPYFRKFPTFNISWKYERLIADLPGLMYCPPVRNTTPIPMRFKGGELLVMRYRGEEQ